MLFLENLLPHGAVNTAADHHLKKNVVSYLFMLDSSAHVASFFFFFRVDYALRSAQEIQSVTCCVCFYDRE